MLVVGRSLSQDARACSKTLQFKGFSNLYYRQFPPQILFIYATFFKIKKNVKTSLISSVTQSKLGPGGLFSTSLVYPFLVLIVIDRPGRGGRLDGRGWGWGDRGVLSALPGRVPSLRIGFLFESCVFTSLLVSGFPCTASSASAFGSFRLHFGVSRSQDAGIIENQRRHSKPSRLCFCEVCRGIYTGSLIQL